MGNITIQDSDIKFMKLAVDCSADNLKTNKGGPFGAVIVKGGKVIACEGNTVTSTNDPTAHAEINAIRAACKLLESPNLEDCIMYTSCEPCPMCTSAIYWAKIPIVFYSNTKTDAEKAGFGDTYITSELHKSLDLRQVVFKRINSVEAICVFKGWIVKTEQQKAATKKGTL